MYSPFFAHICFLIYIYDVNFHHMLSILEILFLMQNQFTLIKWMALQLKRRVVVSESTPLRSKYGQSNFAVI